MMSNKQSNGYQQEDELDLKDIFYLLMNSKKLIIIITFVITLLGAIYSFQKVPQYRSSALIEIGSYYDTTTNKEVLIEPTIKLIQELNIQFIHKNLISGVNSGNFNINLIEGRLFNVSIIETSPENSKDLLSLIVEFIKKRHSKLLNIRIQDTSIQFNNQINILNDQIGFRNTLLTQTESEKLRIFSQIRSLNTQIENQKINLAQEKNNLEIQLKLLESNDFESREIFKLSQAKDNLELELELLLQQRSTSTKLVGEIVTNKINIKKERYIILSFILGLLLSIFMIFINIFFKSFKEK